MRVLGYLGRIDVIITVGYKLICASNRPETNKDN